MKMKYLWTLCLALLINCTLYSQKNNSQDDKDIITIITNDGSTIIGELNYINKDSIKIDSKDLGSLTFAREDVEYSFGRASEEDSQDDDTPYQMKNAFDNQYMITQSAFPITQSYYMNTLLFGHTVGLPVSERFSLSASLEPISSLAYRSLTLGLNFKGNIPLGEKVRACGGLALASGNSQYLLLPYAGFTYGEYRNHITLMGYYLDVDDSNYFNITTSGTLAIAERASLMGEMTFSSENLGIMIGLRRYAKSNRFIVNLGLGAFGNIDEDFGAPLLYFSIVRPW